MSMFRKDGNKMRIEMLVYGFVKMNYESYIPRILLQVIVEFHGLYDISFESNILNDNKTILMELICNQLNNNKLKLSRLYSGKLDGFTTNMFHTKCDNQGPTICLIKNEYNTIFGGYTAAPWTNKWKLTKDDTAFLYQLFPQQKVYIQKHPTNGPATHHHDTLMCAFGDQCDLAIKNNCNTNTKSYATASGYTLSKGSDLAGGIDNAKYDKKYVYFRVIDIEVFNVDHS
mmetsp:Transcript_84399/g.103432  ORF Transcript_84399/g.103432 Transcript_84399/m.103432 type:complete len:229 (-) Transcript_84399:6-692(-)